jgi:DNA-binding IclR family transcriptional regulator
MSSSISKSFWVIRYLRHASGAVPLSEIAKAAKIAPSTAHSTLGELVKEGVVVQDDERRYRLGPALFYLGTAYARRTPIVRAAWTDLIELARELSLTAVLAVPWENHHLMVSVYESGGVEVALGGRVPIDAGSFGKVYFASSGASVPADLTAFTPNSIIDQAAYHAELDRVRSLGYATDREEFGIGVGAVGGGVTSQRGFEGIAALLGWISHLAELGVDDVGQRLGDLTARASYSLGDPSRRLVVGAE